MATEKLKEFRTTVDDEEMLRAYNANFEAHKVGITTQQSAEYYTKWARTGAYDQDILQGKIYTGPKVAASVLAQHFPSNRDTVSILDIAAGTGYVAEELLKHGFKVIDALDPSEGMLEVARSKGLYRKYICEFFTEGTPGLQEDEYDCCVVSGGMGEGHIPCSGLREMIRVIKPGGLVCIAMREEYLSYVEDYKNKLEPLMSQLENEGKWRRLSREVIPNYSFNKNGIVFKYEKCKH
ncbi:methyltransferase-like protein 27 [Patella vulgata]|uniref:methyltransferase-like protein 27 n=1 Tax=Patella vulgata TaxID=6465 RepID=UPI0024A85166|nr:methyltransferase-like protein 27 [Patella vulgata]XP_050395333.2 methyltransferase-like protein 27 [Patella vulgata]XP_050395334.2 methyltransferase-like protein 27 [Patella vulgata]